MQTNFDNDEAVGYLADRLAKLGVEDELRHKGAKPGDEVRIAVATVPWNSIGSDHRGRRGNARRHPVGRTRRRPATAGIGWSCAASFNTERRRQYHEMMDARQAVREAMMAERKAGHWADPSVDDDRHDETSLFGRGETADDEDVEQ